MKKLLPLLLALVFAGCSTISENRTANDNLHDELKSVMALQYKKFETARPILILGHNAEHPNSVGGIDVTLTFQNLSGKTIKYALFTFTPINRVGDVVGSEIAGKSMLRLRATGPYSSEYNGDGGCLWEAVWYNSTIAFARLDKVEIEYMDSTRDSIEGEALPAIQLRPENNDFSSGLQQKRKVNVVGGKLFVHRRDIGL